MPSVKETLELWKIIDERLSPLEVKTCKSLLNDFMSHRIGRNQVHTSLGRLFKKDEYLHQRFTQLFPYTEDQEDADMEEGEIREEEDQHILRDDDPKIYHRSVANHKIRVSNVSPSYRLFMWPEEEKESRVSERALNNKCILIKVDTCGGKILTGQEKAMAKGEDEMYHADLLIGTVRSAIRSMEKVMSGEMRMEHLGASFYRCVKKLLRRRRDTVNETALPGILTQLKEKLDKLIVARENKKSGWKKVLQRQRIN